MRRLSVDAHREGYFRLLEKGCDDRKGTSAALQCPPSKRDDAPLSEFAGACGTLTGTLLTKSCPLVGWILNEIGPDPRGMHLHPEMS